MGKINVANFIVIVLLCHCKFRYQLAENIDAQLKRMVQDLKEIIDHLNTTNSNQDNNDPVGLNNL